MEFDMFYFIIPAIILLIVGTFIFRNIFKDRKDYKDKKPMFSKLDIQINSLFTQKTYIEVFNMLFFDKYLNYNGEIRITGKLDKGEKISFINFKWIDAQGNEFTLTGKIDEVENMLLVEFTCIDIDGNEFELADFDYDPKIKDQPILIDKSFIYRLRYNDFTLKVSIVVNNNEFPLFEKIIDYPKYTQIKRITSPFVEIV